MKIRLLKPARFIVMTVLLSTSCEEPEQIPEQIPEVFVKTFGGSRDEEGYSVQQTFDGGYIITGFTCSYGAGLVDVWLIKTDVHGDTVWTSTFGGSSSEWGHSVRQTSDGGYIITGLTYSYGAGNEDVWLIKADTYGNELWTKTFGGDRVDRGNSVRQTSDGGYIITGFTYSYGAGGSDIWLIKTDASGDTLWTRTFGGERCDEGYSVQQTSDGGYIITGFTYSYGAGGSAVWLIKTNASGDTLWTRAFGGRSGSVDWGTSVQQTFDEGYIVTGFVWEIQMDILLLKTDASGDTLWTRAFGGSKMDRGNSVQQTFPGGYIITGYTDSDYYGAGNSDVWLIKTDASGDTLWTKAFGGSSRDEAYSVQQTADGGFIITGRTDSCGEDDSDVWLIKTDENGNME